MNNEERLRRIKEINEESLAAKVALRREIAIRDNAPIDPYRVIDFNLHGVVCIVKYAEGMATKKSILEIVDVGSAASMQRGVGYEGADYILMEGHKEDRPITNLQTIQNYTLEYKYSAWLLHVYRNVAGEVYDFEIALPPGSVDNIAQAYSKVVDYPTVVQHTNQYLKVINDNIHGTYVSVIKQYCSESYSGAYIVCFIGHLPLSTLLDILFSGKS